VATVYIQAAVFEIIVPFEYRNNEEYRAVDKTLNTLLEQEEQLDKELTKRTLVVFVTFWVISLRFCRLACMDVLEPMHVACLSGVCSLTSP
jgi:hypothetical protein